LAIEQNFSVRSSLFPLISSFESSYTVCTVLRCLPFLGWNRTRLFNFNEEKVCFADVGQSCLDSDLITEAMFLLESYSCLIRYDENRLMQQLRSTCLTHHGMTCLGQQIKHLPGCLTSRGKFMTHILDTTSFSSEQLKCWNPGSGGKQRQNTAWILNNLYNYLPRKVSLIA
jgi:hypothetical protein